jgi:hypothetical protein
MYLPVAFLMKDFLFLAASFYLLKQDLTRGAEDRAESSLPDWERAGDRANVAGRVAPVG